MLIFVFAIVFVLVKGDLTIEKCEGIDKPQLDASNRIGAEIGNVTVSCELIERAVKSTTRQGDYVYTATWAFIGESQDRAELRWDIKRLPITEIQKENHKRFGCGVNITPYDTGFDVASSTYSVNALCIFRND